MKKSIKLILGISLLFGALLLSACSTGGNTLDGTSWELKSYLDGNGEMANKKIDTVVTAYFQGTKISGSAGCNNYNSTYARDGDKLTFSPAASTRKVCADPAGIMEQEEAVLTRLTEVQSYKMTKDTLEMRNAKGDAILLFTPIGQ